MCTGYKDAADNLSDHWEMGRETHFLLKGSLYCYLYMKDFTYCVAYDLLLPTIFKPNEASSKDSFALRITKSSEAIKFPEGTEKYEMTIETLLQT